MMTGLDHRRASLPVREQFAVSKEKMPQVLLAIKAHEGVSGCVIISTCNRTELYASVLDGARFEPSKVLCSVLGKDYRACSDFFLQREDDEVIDHLCRTASGVDSQILGDDQIITQVREALEISRESTCADSYLETLFRTAIQAAKAIKSQVILKSLGFDSVPGKAVEKLKSLCPLDGLSAVVIGNGQMGRLVAELLVAEGVTVRMTLREFKKGEIKIPPNVGTVAYSDRYKAIEQADIVISATTSPHYTLFATPLRQLQPRTRILVDLALPRDVEPLIKDLPMTTLLTLDDISAESRILPGESLSKIDLLVKEHRERYKHWQNYKGDLVVHTQEKCRKKVVAVGLGPGDSGYLAPRAREALEQSEVIVGYSGYMDLIMDLACGKECLSTGMKGEAQRCRSAIEIALTGKQVCVICSGDAGIYGMASLLYELGEGHPDLEIEVIPGITAAAATAAVLGSPLTNDFAVISLSDYLTPWEVIEKRLDACSQADMVICLYNPQSRSRKGYLKRACEVMARSKPPETLCGYARNALRGAEHAQDLSGSQNALCTLALLPEAPVDMFTTVIIGNSSTREIQGRLVTTRGYQL